MTTAAGEKATVNNDVTSDSSLPEGWATASFMDLFDIQGGTQPPKAKFVYEPRPGYVRLLQIRDFGEKPLPTYIPLAESLKTCQPSDILIGRYGASVGRICTGLQGAYNVALAKVAIAPPLNREFVRRLLQSEWFQGPILEVERSAQNGFNKGNLERITVPVCPEPEQRRIVTKVNQLFPHVSAACEHLVRVPGILERFRKAVLAAAASGSLTADWRESNEDVERPRFPIGEHSDSAENEELGALDTPQFIPQLPETWAWANVHKACEKIIDYRGRTPPVAQSGIPHVRTTNIRFGSIKWKTEKYVTQATYDKYMTRGIPKAGDVLFTMEGPLGEAAVLRDNRPFSIAQRILLLRGLQRVVDGGYLAWILMSPPVRAAIEARGTGSTVKGIAYKRFRYVTLPIPPSREQSEIVRRVEALFKLADAIEERVAAATARAEKLTQAILAKAFRGELVPTEAELARREGRNYEPAAALLDRIRNRNENGLPKRQRIR